MNRFIMILILDWPLLFVSGQDNLCNCKADQKSIFESVLTGESFQMKKTSGNQLFRDSSFNGDIILTSGDTVRNKKIGYNGYEDELIWTMPVSLRMIKVDKETVDKFILDKDEEPVAFKHLRGTTSDERKIDLFARVLLEDSISLYATNNIRFDEKIENNDGSVITLIDRIEPVSPVYYLGLRNNKYLEVKHLRKKYLYVTLPEYKDAIRNILTRMHQPLRNERDLIRIVQLFNVYKIIK
jgi:hypothetical protein